MYICIYVEEKSLRSYGYTSCSLPFQFTAPRGLRPWGKGRPILYLRNNILGWLSVVILIMWNSYINMRIPVICLYVLVNFGMFEFVNTAQINFEWKLKLKFLWLPRWNVLIRNYDTRSVEMEMENEFYWREFCLRAWFTLPLIDWVKRGK